MSGTPLRWGIATAGKICHDFTNAINMLPRSDHQIVAVAARDLGRAKTFAETRGIPKFYASYEELSNDASVDVVYVGSVNIAHASVCKTMLNAGKPVLCEKPLTLSYESSKELVDLARKKNLFFMEGIWSRCMPAYRQLREALERKSIGDVKSLVVTFGVKIIQFPGLAKNEIGGGCIVNIGIYMLQLALLVFGTKPISTHFAGSLTEEGVDECCSMTLQYESGKLANMICDGRVDMGNEAVIYGTEGNIKIPSPFWSPMGLQTPEKTFDYPVPPPPQPMILENSENFIHEAEEVRHCINSGAKESSVMTLEESLHLAKLMDKARASVGVKYRI